MYNEEFYTNCSGVKFRKKKKKDKQEEDINSLHYKVQIRFQEDISFQKHRLDQLLKMFQETEIPYGIESFQVKKILQSYELNYTPTNKVSYSEFKDLLKEFSQIDVKMIEYNFEVYKSSCKTILDLYEKVLNKPVKINFFSSNKENSNKEELENIKKVYFDLVERYYKEFIQKDFCHVEKKEEKEECSNCGGVDFIEEANYKKTCENCGFEFEFHITTSEFNDVERVNFSKKYTYKKFIHFRDTLKNFQGKQNRIIDESLLIKLENEMIKDGLVNINANTKKEKFEKLKKDHLRTYLDLIGENKHYENINLIYSKLTLQDNYIITSELEEDLMKDFDLFKDTFLEISKEEKDIDRTNILSSSYILYQLLRRRSIKVKEEEFSLPSSPKCRYKQEYIYAKCCEKLGWNYVSIL
jgi:hypothetical protein